MPLPSNCSRLAIITQYFEEGHKHVWFDVEKKGKGPHQRMKLSALDLFYDDQLLEQFSLKDIRVIVYFATRELLTLDRSRMKNK